VNSPTLSSTPQVDAYRPLLLPIILVGSCHLGGISTTLSAYESLLLRGYSIDCIVLFRNTQYRNAEYLEEYFARNNPEIFVQTVQEPPPRLSNQREEFKSMESYYRDIAASDDIASVLHQLNVRHMQRIETLESMPRRAIDTVWWPFVQHGIVKSQDVTVIDSANSDFFSVCPPLPTRQQGSFLRPHFDGSASWWTQALGHAHPALTIAAARAAGRYGHVMFPQAIHLPALTLAERLLYNGPGKGWASRVFFSDDGATGMEVALKMALRASSVSRGSEMKDVEKKKLGVIGLKGSYHGDTIGAMDACEEGVFSSEWHDAKGYWFDPPTISIRKGNVVLSFPAAMIPHEPPSNCGIQTLSSVYNVPQRLDSPLASFYRTYITSTLAKLQSSADSPVFGALVLEPLVMGAGGMIFVDPLFQRVLIDVVRGAPPKSPTQWIGLPVIFDEVFVGLYRLGVESTAFTLGVTPDISVYAKILTGGLLPLAVTLASDSIFRGFWSENKLDALLHGHSYTAHAVGCEVANETLRILKGLEVDGGWDWAKERWASSKFGQKGQNLWSFWSPEFVSELSSLGVVEEVMALGTVLSIKIKDGQAGMYCLVLLRL
jgi:dethiobiotin synthetase/adenosylmethionine--8-amino-7-oxononanoate aminotransferase